MQLAQLTPFAEQALHAKLVFTPRGLSGSQLGFSVVPLLTPFLVGRVPRPTKIDCRDTPFLVGRVPLLK